MAEKELSLIQKIANIQSGQKELIKEGSNKQQNYKYLTEAQVKSSLRKPLADAGIIIIPSYEIIREWDEKSSRGSTLHYANVIGNFKLTDGQNELNGTMPGTGMDPGDKAIYKAETGAQKNFLMQLFLMSTGNDPEIESQSQPQQSNYGNQNNYNRNNYSNGNRSSNYSSRSNSNNNSNQNFKKQKLNTGKLNQIKKMMNECSQKMKISIQELFGMLHNNFDFEDLERIDNGMADAMITYLGGAPVGGK